MKVSIWNGRQFDFDEIENETDLMAMSDDDLNDLLKNVIDEREGCTDMDNRGLVLDEVYNMITCELSNRKNRPHLKNNFLCDIIDELDEWLIKKGIRIPNEERDLEDPENESNFYGDDFDWLMEMMREECARNGIIVEDEWED